MQRTIAKQIAMGRRPRFPSPASCPKVSFELQQRDACLARRLTIQFDKLEAFAGWQHCLLYKKPMDRLFTCFYCYLNVLGFFFAMTQQDTENWGKKRLQSPTTHFIRHTLSQSLPKCTPSQKIQHFVHNLQSSGSHYQHTGDSWNSGRDGMSAGTHYFAVVYN